MASEGPNNPGTMNDDNSFGTIAWSNPNNAKNSDNSYATASTTNDNVYSHYLKATNFGFSIPSGVTIEGIYVEIERKKNAGSTFVFDEVVKIVKSDSSLGSENKFIDYPAGQFPETDTYQGYGDANDLWSEAWTPSDINNSNFGVVYSCEFSSPSGTPIAYIDNIRITVYYTEAPSVIGPFPTHFRI